MRRRRGDKAYRKQFCSIILAAALVMGSVMPAFAAEGGTIASEEETAVSEIAAENGAVDGTEQITPGEGTEQVTSGDGSEHITSDDGTDQMTSDDDQAAPDDQEKSEKGESASLGETDEAADQNAVLEPAVDEPVEGATAPEVSVSAVEGLGDDDSEEMFAEYVERLFEGEDIHKRAQKAVGSKFEGATLFLYTELRNGAEQVASGQSASTEFAFDVEDLGYGSSNAWSASELGVEAVVVDGSITQEAVNAAFARAREELQTKAVTDALLADCPYELYWYDKTAGVSSGSSIGATYSGGEWKCYISGQYTFSFAVASEFSAGEYTADTNKTGAATAAVSNAQDILSAASGLSDMEKLNYYKEEICDLVSYNDEAAGGGVSYGNPWQMIWVFDQDPTTNVVCEGYAKAFKYLCDQSSFNGDISCITVTGTMSGGTGEGPHMWNIVNMEDGKNYLVDVTNCDEGTIGAPDQLFLAGTPDKTLGGEQETGYIIHAMGGDTTYQYDADTLELYSQDDLSLSDTSYVVNYGNESVYMPSTGDVKVLYVMVNFADVALSESEKDGFGGAVVYNTQFYESSSYGKLRLNADTRECTVARTRSFYEDPHQDGSNDISYGRELFLKDVLHELDSTTDFSEYDSNNDGYIDGLFIRFAGNGSGWGRLWSSYTAQEHEGFTVDGVKTSWYVYLDSHSLTTLVHETGHLLGLPDYYDNRWGSMLSENIAESQDIMFDGIGEHNAYSKYVLGWIDHPYIVDALDSINNIQLRPSMYYPDAAIIYPNGDRNSEQFFVVEYVTSSYGLSIKSNNYGGLRIWRVDSAKSEQRNDQIPLIRSVQCGGNTFISNQGWQTMLDNGQNYYSSIFYTGDELTPYTNPSSYIYADPNGSMDDLAFSGVSVTSINTEGETASCSVTIDSEPSENALEYTLQYSADSALIFKLSFNHDISVRNEEDITITYNGQALDGTEVDVVNNTELNVSCSQNIVKENQYTLTIPAGTIVTTYGKENEEIVFTATAYGFRNVSTVDKQAEGQHLVSPVYEFSDGSLSFFKLNNNALYLCTYENDEIHESVILEADSLTHLATTQMNAGQYVLRFFKDERGVTYLYDVNDGLQLIKVHDPEEPVSSGAFPAGDDKIIYNIFQNYYSLTFDGEVQSLNTDINTVEGVVYPIKDSRFVYADNITDHLKLLDSEFNVLKEIPNTGIMESREHIDEIMEDGGYIYVFSIINKAFYVTIYDANFNFIRKTQVLSQDGIKERIGHVYKTEDGFIITGSVQYEQISHGGVIWNVSGGRIWVCDESFELITSYTDIESGKSTDFDNVIVTDNGAIIASNWKRIAQLDNWAPVVEETEKAPVPNITKQPQDVSGKEGESVTLSVEAEGGELSYNWQVNNEEGVWENVDGKTDHITVELTVAPQTYRCLVKNKAYNMLASRVVQCKGGDYEHTSIKFVAKAATCTEEGNIEYYECIDCHKLFSDEESTIEITEEDIVIPATGHSYGEWTVTKEATCTENGSREKVCPECGDKVTEEIPATGHAYGEWTVTKEATCTEAGSKEKVCANCGDKITEEISATGHAWSDWTVVREATEEEEGLERRTCSNDPSHTEERTIPKLTHVHELTKTEAKEASCTVDGNVEFWTCSKCGKVYSDGEGMNEVSIEETIIHATGHEWNTEYTVDKEATCTEEGSESIHCSVCGESDENSVQVIPATGHSYGEWTVVREATCTEAGSKEKVCASCGDKVTEEIPATGHAYGEWTVTKEATCTENGSREKVCAVCGFKVTEEILSIGHVWNSDYSVDTEATCTEEGSESIHCSVCGVSDEKTVRVIPAKGHSYGEWTVVRDATCTEAGSKEKVCASCGDKVTEEIPATGHAWSEWTVVREATCTEDGSREKVCGNCGDKITEEIPATGHAWSEWTVVREATEEEEGLERRTCSNDPSHTEERTIPKLAHVHNLTKTEAKEASCTEDGNIEFWTCSKCGRVYSDSEGVNEINLEETVIHAAGHKWNTEYTVDKEATCTEEGYESIHCSVCDAIDENTVRAIAKTEHTYGDWTVTKEATCTEGGSREKVCANCGDKVTETIPATGHAYGEWTVIKEATCTEDGSREKVCANCEDKITETIPATGHAYGDWTVIKEATCTEDGIREKVCGNCGDKVTETILSIGHVWDDEYTLDKEATCSEEGSESIHCSVCDAINETTVRVIPKTEHEYGDWTVTKEATCTEGGSREKVCANCGDKVTETIPAIGHAYGEWTVIKEATCTEDGSREKVCANCGNKVTETILTIGHVWEDEYTVDKEATYTEEGSESIHCSVCDAINESTVRPIPVLKGTWKQDRNGWWYDRGDGTYPKDGFEEIEGTTYYFDASGYMKTGWVEDDGDWYYFAASGAMVKDNWQQSGSAWHYFGEDGKMLTGLQEINGTSYFFKDSGAMATGWQEIDGDWYFFAGSGAMVKKNWQQSSSTWYYFGEDGKMLTGLQEINGKSYFFKDGGAMASGWQEIDGDWYYFDASGAMVKENWQQSGNTWYYFDGEGKMLTGLQEIGGRIYFFKDSGAMVTGWQQVGDDWYYFESSGAAACSKWVGNYYMLNSGVMATNQWVDNDRYYVGADGLWIQGYVEPN